MSEPSESEKEIMFKTLCLLRNAIEDGIVEASDIIELIGRKIEEEKNKHQPPPQDKRWQKQQDERQRHHHHERGQNTPMMRIRCKFCHGLGHSSSQPCPVCNGAKEVAVPQDAVRCGNCHGLGDSNGLRCKACSGTGMVSVKHYR